MLAALRHCAERMWWCALAYAVAMRYVVREFLARIRRSRGLPHRAYPSEDGKYAVVTGGSRGIGLEIVQNLLDAGYNVVIGSSAPESSRCALEMKLRKKYLALNGSTVDDEKVSLPAKPFLSKVEVWHLDLASLKSVKTFCEKYLSTGWPLYLLINNAGIMFVKEETTEDGFEKHFSVNYLSHCLLTLLLLPRMAESGKKNRKSRIINCSSCIHYVGQLDVEQLEKREYYSKYKAYIESKLAQVMFTYSLQSYLKVKNMNVTTNCVHPGVVNTELMTSVLWIPSLGSLILKSPKEGAETATYVALSSEIENVGGKYFEECTPVASSNVSLDVKKQEALWKKTLSFLKPWLNEKQYYFVLSNDTFYL